MSARLPPLEALRYFEAAARHLSFTHAADELCVTQSAVSQKVIQLEQRLGYALFERHIRRLTLTEQGALIYPVVQTALGNIRDVLSTAQIEYGHKLTIYCVPSFASRWLMPRLYDFHSHYPDIDLHIMSSPDQPDFKEESIDIGICHGHQEQPDMVQELLFWDYIYPVATPQVIRRDHIKTPLDLSQTILLHDALPLAKLATSWPNWLSEHGLSQIDCRNGYRFNQADHIVRAALDSRGVALGRHVLVAAEVKRGRLQPLFEHYQRDDGVYLVYQKKQQNAQSVSAFSKWLKQQALLFNQQMNVEQLVTVKAAQSMTLSTDYAK
ncbi:LysR substrate-binding domain-containing protein [Celerinatantimonas sp. MCCC 1A17872]|uniref:LysR substrate-binding domain-containing protein n=1 Tax=Celerinatantimonas sp. MCCC 1A17872 TaxID=3177514 RepID=UPI0038C86F6B